MSQIFVVGYVFLLYMHISVCTSIVYLNDVIMKHLKCYQVHIITIIIIVDSSITVRFKSLFTNNGIFKDFKMHQMTLQLSWKYFFTKANWNYFHLNSQIISPLSGNCSQILMPFSSLLCLLSFTMEITKEYQT